MSYKSYQPPKIHSMLDDNKQKNLKKKLFMIYDVNQLFHFRLSPIQ